MEFANGIVVNISKISKPSRFYLPYSEEDVKAALTDIYSKTVAERGGNYVGESYDAISMAASWLVNREKKPGLLLYGKVGTGKTTLMRSIVNLINWQCKPGYTDISVFDAPKRCIDMVTSKDVIAACSEKHSWNCPEVMCRYERMKRAKLLAVDDFGMEASSIKSFGNECEPMTDLISERYDSQRMTIISSNMDMNNITERYGIRVADRINEMCAKIGFTSESFRK